MEDLITRLTYDGQLVTAPVGTRKCQQGVRPHPTEWTHWLFAPDDPGPMLQLMTRCGRRAHRFVLESEGKEVDCPECSDEPTLWKIAIRDDIRAFMATDPSPYWASTESERDWFLEKQLKRPREDYTVEEVRGPIERAIDDERGRYDRVRKQLHEERHKR